MAEAQRMPGDKPRVGRYVVEIALNGDYPDVRNLSTRAREAAGDVRAGGTPVRFVRAVFVPEDGACLLVFEAADAQAVREVAVAAGLNLSQLTAVLTAKEE